MATKVTAANAGNILAGFTKGGPPQTANYQKQAAVSARDTAYGGGMVPVGSKIGLSMSPIGTNNIPRVAAPAPQASQVWDDNARNSGGGQPDYNSINDLYAPQIDYLNQLSGQVDASKLSQMGDVNSKYDRDYGMIAPEQASLEKGIYGNEQQFQGDTRSAYDEAYRAYNALGQQSRARFGGGSSAGMATSDLANQELQRQVGKVGQEATQGSLEFEKQRNQLTQYITQKTNSLKDWKDQAVAKINDNFTNLMGQINANRVATEQQKSRDKLALLQSTVQQSQAIAQADQQFKQQLALFAVQQLANTTGQQFTPQQIKFQVQDIMKTLSPQPMQASAQGGLSGAGSLAGLFGKPQDQQQVPG